MTHNKRIKSKYLYQINNICINNHININNYINNRHNINNYIFIDNHNNHIRKLSQSKLMILTLNILQQINLTKKLINLKTTKNNNIHII